MNILNFDKAANFDIDISNIVCSNQIWSNKHHSFSYLDFPRPCDGLIYFCKGCAIYKSANSEIITAHPNDILYLPEGSRYFVKFFPSTSRSMLLNFNSEYKNTKISFADKITFVTHDKNRILYEMFDTLCLQYAKSTNKLIIKSMFFQLISNLSLINSDIENSNPLNKATEYINNHLNTNINIGKLAEMCAMSESTFYRKFVSMTKKSPKKYIIEKKTEKAKKLLETSELSIGAICDTLGFYDCACFTKQFKQQTSKTPLEYRNEHLGKNKKSM